MVYAMLQGIQVESSVVYQGISDISPDIRQILLQSRLLQVLVII